MTESERCQSIFRNLLAAAKDKSSACAYIRELAFTERCDKFYNLSDVRKSHAELVGEAAMERIVEYKETDEDKRRATQAVFHYSTWTTERLKAALTWPKLAIKTVWSLKS
jgi:hypothetical protein